jgi:hypothetical protein
VSRFDLGDAGMRRVLNGSIALTLAVAATRASRCSPMIAGVRIKGEFILAQSRYCCPLTVSDFATRSLISCGALSTTRESMRRHQSFPFGGAARPERSEVALA